MDKIKMAYLLLVHKNPEQVNMFIEQLLNYGDCDIYIHVDKKAENIISDIRRDNRIHVVSKYFVSWGSFEIVKAAIELMNMVMNSGNAYTHMYFGSGQDLLVKKGLYEYLLENRDKIFLHINGEVDKSRRASARYRIRWPHKLMIRNDLHPYRFIRIAMQFLCKFGIVVRPNKKIITNKVTFYEGRTWFIAPIDVLEYIVKYIKTNSDYVDFWEDSLASDLMFFQTIIMNSPYAGNVEDELMYVNFGGTFSTMNHPLTITMDDVEKIDNGKFYCARKFENSEEQESIKYYLKKMKLENEI